MRIIGNLDGTGRHYKVVEGKKIRLTADEKASFMLDSAKFDKAILDNKYKQSRLSAYNSAFSLSDQFDIIQKQFRSMASKGEIVITKETQSWLDKIALIKSDNPKPTE